MTVKRRYDLRSLLRTQALQDAPAQMGSQMGLDGPTDDARRCGHDALARRVLWVVLTIGLLATLLGHAQAAVPEAKPMLMIERGQHGAPVRRVDVSLSRGIAVTASDDRTARIWDLASGQVLRVLRPRAFGEEGGRLYGVAIHPTEPIVAVGGSTGGTHEGMTYPHLIYLFDTDSGALRGTIDARAGDVRRLVWSADGQLLWAAYAGTHGVRAFTRDGREVLDDRMDGGAFGLTVSPSGRDAAAVGLDGSLRVYRSTGACCGPVQRVKAIKLQGRKPLTVAYSPDGGRLAVAFYQERGAGVEVLDAVSLVRHSALPAPESVAGDWRVAAWTRDGLSLVLGGTAYDRDLMFHVVRAGIDGARPPVSIAATTDAVTDIQVLSDGGIAVTAFDGTWTWVKREGEPHTFGRSLGVLAKEISTDLQLSADARGLRWAQGTPEGGYAFDFESRRLVAAPGRSPFAGLRGMFDSTQRALRPPQVRVEGIQLSGNWRMDGAPPLVSGRRVELQPGEPVRAVISLSGAQPAVIFASNQALYRVDGQGKLLWRLRVDTEVRALNASSDSRVIVGFLADGTMRWWRAADGVHLMSLLVDGPDRWLAWTPSGYFDASAGADRLAGWAVPQGNAVPMAFYSLGRFRETFNRPEVIDAVMSTLDEPLALAQIRSRQELEQATWRAEAERQAQASLEAKRKAELRAEQARQAAAESLARAAAAERAEREARARQTAEREAQEALQAAVAQAQREAARRQADLAAQRAREAQERLRAEREAALAADRAAAMAEAERQQESRRAAEAERLALQIQREAEEGRRAHEARVAAEVARLASLPPAAQGVSTARIKVRERMVTLPFAVRSPEQAGAVQLSVRLGGLPVTPREVVMPRALDGEQQGFARMELPASMANAPLQAEILLSNRNGYAEPLVFYIEPETAKGADAKGRGDLYVLAIGVAQYERAEYQLILPAKDASDFAAALKAQEGRAYRRVVTRVLTDAQATRVAVLQAFDWLRNSAGPSDTAMLFLAGHGINDSHGRFYFLPRDARHERLAATGVSQAAIVSTLAAIRGRTVMFIDTCFAGNSLGQMDRRRTERLINDLVSNENGVVVYASSTGHEVSLERPSWGNGAFTKALLEGLGGRADLFQLGQVTSATLNAYLSRAVAQITEGRQRPVFISPRGVPDFTLATL